VKMSYVGKIRPVGYSRKIILNLSLLTTGTFIYECVLCEFSQ
jgi:hypothetical protein